MYKVIYAKGTLGHSNLARSSVKEYGDSLLEREIDATDFNLDYPGFVVFTSQAGSYKKFALPSHAVIEISEVEKDETV